MKILKLSISNEASIYANFDKVTDFAPNKRGGTMICFGDEDYHFSVLENADEIFNMLKEL